MKNLNVCSNYLSSSIKHITKILILLFVFEYCSYSQAEQSDSVTVQSDTAKFVMQKSPWGAVLRSAIIPGFGQFYTESYWKIPVIWGFLGYFVYEWGNSNSSYIQYRDLFLESLKSSSAGNQSYYRLREFYKDQRDLFAVYIGLTYFLNLVDAYVDAQLFDFDVSKNYFNGQYNFSVRLNFNSIIR